MSNEIIGSEFWILRIYKRITSLPAKTYHIYCIYSGKPILQFRIRKLYQINLHFARKQFNFNSFLYLLQIILQLQKRFEIGRTAPTKIASLFKCNSHEALSIALETIRLI